MIGTCTAITYVLSIGKIYCGISVHLFCDRGSLEFKKMVMSSQSVLGEEKRMKRLGGCTFILYGHMGQVGCCGS